MNDRKKQLLKDFPWEENYPKLVAFADWVIAGKTWNSSFLPKGQTAESIVQDAIAKTFTEVRNWDPEKGELFDWLKWVIKSEISHLATSAANKKDVRIDHLDDNDSVKPSSPRPQDISPEKKIIAAETVDILLKACDGKTELEEIILAVSSGECSAKPQSLSEYLGRPVGEINLQLRALRRRASKLRMEDENANEQAKEK